MYVRLSVCLYVCLYVCMYIFLWISKMKQIILSNSKPLQYQEPEEIDTIPFTNTGAHPGTMVIVCANTSPAVSAVFGPQRLMHLAHLAEAELRTRLGLKLRQLTRGRWGSGWSHIRWAQITVFAEFFQRYDLFAWAESATWIEDVSRWGFFIYLAVRNSAAAGQIAKFLNNDKLKASNELFLRTHLENQNNHNRPTIPICSNVQYPH